MAQIILTVNDVQLARLADAVARRQGYRDTIQDPLDATKTIPNPETKAQFVRRWLINMLRNEVVLDELQQRIKQAQDDAVANAPVMDIT